MRKTRRLHHILYNWLVIGLGFWLLAHIFPFLNLDLGREFLILVTLGVLAEWLAVVMPQGQLSGGFAVILASFLIYGPVATAWINGLATALGQGVANRGNPLRTTLFNSAQYVLAVLGANFVYVTAGGAADRGLDRVNVLPLALFILAYFFINQIMVYFYTLPARNGYPLFAWRDALRWDVLTYLLAVPFGILMGLLHAKTGIYGTALLFMPVLGVQFVLRYYVHLELANRELRVLYEVARRLGGSLNLQEILDLVLRETRRVINFHTGIIYLWSDDKECYLAGAVSGPYAELIRGSEVRKGEGFLGLAVENGDTLLVYDTREDVRSSGDIGLTQVHRSMVVVPLKAKTETLGLIVLGDKRPGFFEDKHLQTLTIFGGQAAVAIANARLYRKLEQCAVTDGLTGLYGFPYFYRRAAEELERAGHYGDDLSLAVLDIEHFGQINDRYGHLAGDAVLARVGRVIREEVRSCDLAARYGGGKFAVLMPRTGPSEAVHVVERLRLAVREYLFEVEDRRIPVRLRTGTATYPEQAADLEALIKAAGSDLN
ncbi:sensor domain-containing diguanylate cyclase [Desulfoscipio geothermicus]|uniref:Diguanylate cyclase with GAF sensor n=1 Tax=Desulfoscipio geothermicus DSM 3669 TaxID=1121426 RepID=A0A1I6DDU9_9FIRM|nr:sensor domain-containing diguanylate cyclase [Desulfoscipio geothermicus]SFR03650.1 diguanylate cyclase with GAF sensor [Desulfoscipio geothermicus DSM 3669]